MKRMLSIVMTLVLGVGTVIVAGCETKAQTGALIGAAAGAGAGQLIGRNTAGTLIGAGVGAVGGYIIGNEMDKADQRKAERTTVAPASATAASGNTETVWITNSNGSQIPVKLVRDGNEYIGPRGERYTTKPTEEQLRAVYGF